MTDEDWDLTERSTATTLTHRTDETVSMMSSELGDGRLDETMSSVSHTDMLFRQQEMMSARMSAAGHLSPHDAMMMMAAQQRAGAHGFLNTVRESMLGTPGRLLCVCARVHACVRVDS